MMPLVAIVGRPNVGKSTLFNRLIGERKALVHDMPGVTRDRNYGQCTRFNSPFNVVDTGGFDPESKEGMLPMMRQQAQLAVDEADAILFIVDARAGLTPADEQVFAIVRQSSRPVFVVANKVESSKQDQDLYEFLALGIDDVYPVSAEHGLGVGDLIDELCEVLPAYEEPDIDGDHIKIAVIGRPNAGKSTFINRLLGTDRLITSDVAGTTRDSIDTELLLDDRMYTLVDTVGMRRRKVISAAVEKFGVIKAIQSIERCHVAILMCDANQGVTDQDARIGHLAIDRGRALVVAFNKWDMVEKDGKTADDMMKDFRRRRGDLAFAPVIFISALTGQRAIKVLDLVDTAYTNWRRRIPTSQINRWFETTLADRPPPLYKKRQTKLYYVTQARTGPPTFIGQSNMVPDAFPESYRRFLRNRLRASFDFEGTPIRVNVRQRKSKYNQTPE